MDVNLKDLMGFLEVIDDATREPGHGVIDVHPDYESYLPVKPGLVFSNREVVDRETIRFQWMRFGVNGMTI